MLVFISFIIKLIRTRRKDFYGNCQISNNVNTINCLEMMTYIKKNSVSVVNVKIMNSAYYEEFIYRDFLCWFDNCNIKMNLIFTLKKRSLQFSISGDQCIFVAICIKLSDETIIYLELDDNEFIDDEKLCVNS